MICVLTFTDAADATCNPFTAKQSASELCDICRDATVSADIGYFERYRNDTYPTRPDHIRLIIN